jgi:hypothetical protein
MEYFKNAFNFYKLQPTKSCKRARVLVLRLRQAFWLADVV